jgi:hypothetical protein
MARRNVALPPEVKGGGRPAGVGGYAMSDEQGFEVRDRRGRAPEEPAPAGGTPTGAEPTKEVSEPARSDARPGGEQLFPEEAPGLERLFLMFASSALVSLGAAPDPGSGERRVDLPQAREAVDMLLLLRAKTDGNRSPEESRLLEEILYDLQMRFVSLSGRPGGGL